MIFNRRIHPDMTLGQAFLAISGGDRESMQALVDIGLAQAQIDPQSAVSDEGCHIDFLAIVNADIMGLHDRKIGILYHDICDGNAEKAATVIRASMLDIVSVLDLHRNLNLVALNRRHEMDVDAICRKVQKTVDGYVEIVPDGRNETIRLGNVKSLTFGK